MTKKRFFRSILVVLVLIFLFGGCESSSVGQIFEADAEPEEKTEVSSAGKGVQEEGVGESGDGSLEGGGKDSFHKKAGKTGVYIYGAVNKPGVYYLDSNSRVVDLVKAAGGFKENAYRTGVNLAAYLKDADVVRILTKKQAKRLKKDEEALQEAESGSGLPVSEETSKGDAAVNINLAGKEELMSLKGIGESKADAIIEYREEHGSFKSIEEIMEISGIKEGTFNKIKSKITI